MASYQADLAETQYVDGPSSRFAYRRFGPQTRRSPSPRAQTTSSCGAAR
jgi:hypothetical protein